MRSTVVLWHCGLNLYKDRKPVIINLSGFHHGMSSADVLHIATKTM